MEKWVIGGLRGRGRVGDIGYMGGAGDYFAKKARKLNELRGDFGYFGFRV